MIPPQVMSSLSNLEQLEVVGTGLSHNSIIEFLDDLECLKALQHLKLTMYSKNALEKLLRSEKLSKIIYGLYIQHCRGSRSLQL